jgi:transcriptional regulator with XRE-family HTH domain
MYVIRGDYMREWLRVLREEKKMTQAGVANLVGVNVTAINKYELGKRRPSPEIAQKIAVVLGFDWTRFFLSFKEKKDEIA